MIIAIVCVVIGAALFGVVGSGPRVSGVEGQQKKATRKEKRVSRLGIFNRGGSAKTPAADSVVRSSSEGEVERRPANPVVDTAVEVSSAVAEVAPVTEELQVAPVAPAFYRAPNDGEPHDPESDFHSFIEPRAGGVLAWDTVPADDDRATPSVPHVEAAPFVFAPAVQEMPPITPFVLSSSAALPWESDPEPVQPQSVLEANVASDAIIATAEPTVEASGAEDVDEPNAAEVIVAPNAAHEAHRVDIESIWTKTTQAAPNGVVVAPAAATVVPSENMFAEVEEMEPVVSHAEEALPRLTLVHGGASAAVAEGAVPLTWPTMIDASADSSSIEARIAMLTAVGKAAGGATIIRLALEQETEPAVRAAALSSAPSDAGALLRMLRSVLRSADAIDQAERRAAFAVLNGGVIAPDDVAPYLMDEDVRVANAALRLLYGALGGERLRTIVLNGVPEGVRKDQMLRILTAA